MNQDLESKYPSMSPLNSAVRHGLPVTPLTDFYYWILNAKWRGVLSMFAATFLAINVVFAALYLAGGDCIAGARPGSFADAFYFSVQSIATIGYGTLTPANDFANILVTLEAMIGILVTALSTGIVFAKFGRPRANMRFSDKVLIAPYDGRRSLYFRVANIRGNDVAEATISVAALLSHTTAEGHDLKRLHELTLVRSKTPMFRLSWLVVHVIDEASPLWDLELEDLYRDRSMLVVSLVGMDPTFAQSVAARHIYLPESIVFDHHFEDIVSELDDGRLSFDFNKFHHIRPLTETEMCAGKKAELESRASELLAAEVEDFCVSHDQKLGRERQPEAGSAAE